MDQQFFTEIWLGKRSNSVRASQAQGVGGNNYMIILQEESQNTQGVILVTVYISNHVLHILNIMSTKQCADDSEMHEL